MPNVMYSSASDCDRLLYVFKTGNGRLLKYGTHKQRVFRRYLQIAWKEQIKCGNCRVADLNWVGQQI